MLTTIALIPLICGATDLTESRTAAQTDGAWSPMKISAGQLTFYVPDIGLLKPDAAGKQTSQLLTFASSMPEFDCQVSAECIQTIVPRTFEFDTSFRDVLLELPVRGKAHLKGQFSISPAPDGDSASVDVRFAGTIQMLATGEKSGVQIDSSFTTEFNGSKRVECDLNGVHAFDSRCNARSSSTILGVRNVGSTIFGRVRERVADRRAHASARTAEQQCSQHVALGIRVFVDQYVAALETDVKRAFRNHGQNLAADQRMAWGHIRFLTEKDRLIVARGPQASRRSADLDLRGRYLVAAFPCRRPEQIAKIFLALLPTRGSAGLATEGPKVWPFAEGSIRPLVEWESQTVVVSFDAPNRAHKLAIAGNSTD